MGRVTNPASRLYGEAKPGQILVSQHLLGAVDELVEVEPVGERTLKCFCRSISEYKIVCLKA